MKYTWILIAFICGALLPIQAGLNTRLGKAIESPVHASLISFIVGAFAVLAYALITRQHISLAGLQTAPAYVWLGGILGAFYVTSIVMAFPQIGPALTFGLVVAGQMSASLFLDHYNILVAQQHTINVWKLFGVVMVITGVVIIQKFK